MTMTKAVNVRDFDITMGEKKIDEIHVPTEYLGLDWAPNINDHLVVGGEDLYNGAVVMIVDSTTRRSPEMFTPAYAARNPRWAGPTESDRANIDETSRWAIVTGLDNKNQIVRFNAVYADGTVRPRTYNKSYQWAILRRVEVLPAEKDDFGPVLGQVARSLGILPDDEHKFLVEDSMNISDLVARSFGLKRLPLDSKFLDLVFGEPWHADYENSAAGEAAEKPPVSPTNFERRLRDADSRSKVRQILEERDDYFSNRLADKILKGETPDHVTTIPAKELILADVLFLAGSPYTVTGLGTLEGFEDEIQINLNKIGTDISKDMSFLLNEKLVIAGRS